MSKMSNFCLILSIILQNPPFLGDINCVIQLHNILHAKNRVEYHKILENAVMYKMSKMSKMNLLHNIECAIQDMVEKMQNDSICYTIYSYKATPDTSS